MTEAALSAGAVIAGSSANLTVENCVLANNGLSNGPFGGPGVASHATSGASATVRISNCTIVNNGVGTAAEGVGVILSRGNNTIEGNRVDSLGTLGSYAAK